MVKPLRYGLVGYGLNALGHISELTNHPRIISRTRWIVGFDPDPNANQMLNKIEGIKVAKSFEDLLDTAGLDAVIISSPLNITQSKPLRHLRLDYMYFLKYLWQLKKKILKKL